MQVELGGQAWRGIAPCKSGDRVGKPCIGIGCTGRLVTIIRDRGHLDTTRVLEGIGRLVVIRRPEFRIARVS